MVTYRTKQGDSWDSIAHNQLGDTALTHQLMMLNGKYLDYYTFPAGIILELPESDTVQQTSTAPWKQVAG